VWVKKAGYTYRHSLTAHIENLEKRMRQHQELKLEDFLTGGLAVHRKKKRKVL
jgi:hypothetical protein